MPSPGTSNDDAFLALLEDVTIDPERGFYDAPFAVTVTTSTPDATIRYSLDGTAPTATSGSIYVAPLPIDTTTCLRVGVFKPGWKSPPIVTHTYLFLDHVLHQATDPETGHQRPRRLPRGLGHRTGRLSSGSRRGGAVG